MSDPALAGYSAGPERDQRSVFARLQRIRALQRAMLPALKSIVDFDIMLEVGLRQERRQLLRMGDLLLSAAGSVSTVHRSVDRLCKANYLHKSPFDGDRRVTTITITDRVLPIYRQWAMLLAEQGSVSST